MRIVYNRLNECFDLRNDMLNFITVENVRYFEDLVVSVYEQIKKKNEKLGFYINDEEEALHKCADIICSPMDINYDKKELQKKLAEMLIKEIQINDIESNLIELHSKFVDAFEKVQEISEFDIDFSDDFELLRLIKEYDIHLKEPEGCFAEKLLEYMGTVRNLLNKEVFVLINCSAYLNDEDCLHISRWAVYQEVYILFINSYQKKLNIEVNEYIIDLDLCLLH